MFVNLNSKSKRKMSLTRSHPLAVQEHGMMYSMHIQDIGLVFPRGTAKETTSSFGANMEMYKSNSN